MMRLKHGIKTQTIQRTFVIIQVNLPITKQVSTNLFREELEQGKNSV